MRPITVVLSAITIMTACTPSPTSPGPLQEPADRSSVIAPDPAVFHNVSIVFEGQETGPLYWVCATQPRIYCQLPQDGGKCFPPERDHYISVNPCPERPID